MAQKRFRKVRYSSVLARRAGIDEGTQKYSLPKSARAFFPAIESREVTHDASSDARFFLGRDGPHPFFREKQRALLLFRAHRGFRDAHARAHPRTARCTRGLTFPALHEHERARPPASRRTRPHF
jgi:hypothetical protein